MQRITVESGEGAMGMNDELKELVLVISAGMEGVYGSLWLLLMFARPCTSPSLYPSSPV